MKYEIDFDSIPTPCYLLDERKLIKNLVLLQEVIKESGASILCALKGYALWNTFPLLSEYLSGATASSLHEAQLVHNYWKGKAHVCAPVYVPSEMDQILEKASHITFNSLSEWERYKEKVRKTDVSPGLRINPEYSEIETELYNPASPDSRLGIKVDDLTQLPEEIEGLHFHVLCEQDSFVLERVLEKIETQFGELLHQVKWVNMGGGHHITRSNYDTDHLIRLVKAFAAKYQVEVILEPGEAIGWETGFLVSEVLDVIPNGKRNIAMLDTSFTCHMPDCLEMPYKPFVIGAISPNDFFPTYIMGGMTCLAGDQIGDYSFLQPLRVGDKVIFHDMIHYTMVKTSTFNGVRLPSIGVWTKEDTFQLIREYGYEEYVGRLS
ncbi:MAG: carboxynorspermidine decarboxylase [Cyclobacteriaceae bacterium]